MILQRNLPDRLAYPGMARLGIFSRHNVSISSSIFQKPCPACATSVSVSAARCHCGHLFESSANCLSPEEAALRDEELYEGYLAARAEQSQQAARTAEQALSEDASNPEKISAAALAREVAKAVENDLAEQQSKIAAMQSALRAKEPVPHAPVGPSATTVLPAVAVTEKAAPAWPTLKSPAPKRPARSATTIPTPGPVANPTSVSAPAKTASAPVWKASITQKAAGVLAALKNAKARETVTRSQQAIAAAAHAKQAAAHVPPPQPAPVAASAVPSPEFRKEQSSRAEKIMEARQSADAKDCPNCTSSVPLTTTRCRCGFAFVSGGTELPSLTLCTGDFTALRNSLKLNLRS
jgi:hypothetical protein